MAGLLVPPPLGYAVSNHWVKNWLSLFSQAALLFGSQCRKPASSCGSVVWPPPWRRWIRRRALGNLSVPRRWHSAMYAAAGRSEAGALENRPNGAGLDGG